MVDDCPSRYRRLDDRPEIQKPLYQVTASRPGDIKNPGAGYRGILMVAAGGPTADRHPAFSNSCGGQQVWKRAKKEGFRTENTESRSFKKSGSSLPLRGLRVLRAKSSRMEFGLRKSDRGPW